MIKHISSVPFLDTVALFKSISSTKSSHKLKELLAEAGTTFFDEERNFIKKASISVCGFGGLGFDFSKTSAPNALPIRNTTAELNFDELHHMYNPLQATGGFMSYLNTGNLASQEMIDIMAKHGHFSTLHLSYVNIAIFGISSLVENEINCQRDMMHIARITEARTSVQSQPPIVVLYPEQLKSFQKVYEATKKVRSSMPRKIGTSFRDAWESSNSIYPGAKGTGVIISITLKNLGKLVLLLNDNGKEEEFKRVLSQINDISHTLWPHFFKETNSYKYKLPKHLKE